MNGVTRREALRLLVSGGAASMAVAPATVCAEAPPANADAVAMLYDATKCIGCKACVSACAQVNGLEPDTSISRGLWQAPLDLNGQTKNIIKLFKGPAGEGDSFVKQQCMHCLDPACVSGCPFDALHKDQRGVVQWESSRCVGCRYCEVACPFHVPKFEWRRFNPKIVKCEFCSPRLDRGEQPGCTAVCPTGAVIFGKRAGLLDAAKQRIAAQPGKYFENRVYGEHDGGGTQVLYLAAVPFDRLGLPELGQTSVARYAERVHRILYHWMLIPLALYGALVAVIRRHWRHHEAEAHAAEQQSHLQEQL